MNRTSRFVAQVGARILALVIAVLVSAFAANAAIATLGIDVVADWLKLTTFLYGLVAAWAIQVLFKLHDLGDLSTLNAAQHSRLVEIARAKTRRVGILVLGYLLGATLAVAAPLVSHAEEPTRFAVVFAACLAVGLALVSPFMLWRWADEIRAFRGKAQQLAKRRKERDEALKSMAAAGAGGFLSDDRLDGYNRVYQPDEHKHAIG